jgi:anti-anti-sigma factor
MSDTISAINIVSNGSTLVATILEQRMRDAASVQQIKDEMLSAITATTPTAVIIDLQNVEFVGSVAFLVFLSVRRQPSVQRIILCNMLANVREVFQLCKLIPGPHNSSAPFEVAGSVADAEALLG